MRGLPDLPQLALDLYDHSFGIGDSRRRIDNLLFKIRCVLLNLMDRVQGLGHDIREQTRDGIQAGADDGAAWVKPELRPGAERHGDEENQYGGRKDHFGTEQV
ncbi:MAG TPA: hypothetical protein VKY85_01015 [Candidatus Angelobacter sp.]|nr:hypothetical protein [Candidatus Angelobacter sp.]